MNTRGQKIAAKIRAFVDHPLTNLVKGMTLLLIGLSEASHTLVDDVVNRQLRVGHGLVIIGIFSVLASLPHLIEGLEASERFEELRAREAQAQEGDHA